MGPCGAVHTVQGLTWSQNPKLLNPSACTLPPPPPSCAPQLISLSDLENDNTNPFDCADQINRFVLPEYAGQAALTLVLLASRNWLVAAVQVGVSAYLVHLYLRKRVYLHAADAFKQLPSFKKTRTWVFGIQCACFLIVTYG